MKKAIVWIIVMLLLLGCFAGCGKEAGPEEPKPDPESTAAASVPGPGTEPVTEDPTNSSAEPSGNQADLRHSLVKTDQGVYYLYKQVGLGNLIAYYSDADQASYVLCGKPNCSHNSEDCNGYGRIFLTACDGYLYTLDDFARLVRLNLDGTDHIVVSDLQEIDKGGMWVPAEDCVVFFSLPNYSLPYEQQLYRIFRIDCRTGGCTELFRSLTGQTHLNPGEFRTAEGKLYGLMELSSGADEPELWMMELDPAADSWRKLFRSPSIGIWAVYDGVLYAYLPGEGFLEYRLETGDSVIRDAPTEDGWWAAYDPDWIYLMGNERDDGCTLYFLTRDYALVDQIELPPETYFQFSAKGRLYFANDWWGLLTAYLDKSEIGSGQLALRPIENPGK